MEITAYGKTDKGRVRERNEDAFLADQRIGIFAVADGLGGLPDGDRASLLAIESLHQALAETANGAVTDFQILFERINQSVFQEGCRLKAEIGIGTTLTALFLNAHNRYTISHVGDSSAFLYRQGQLFQLTEEHTMEMELRNSNRYHGEYIPEYLSHTLTQCLGQMDAIKANLIHGSLEIGDIFLLCSDGISKVIDFGAFVGFFESASSPQQLVENLIDEANERGGPDNATAVAVFVNAS